MTTRKAREARAVHARWSVFAVASEVASSAGVNQYFKDKAKAKGVDDDRSARVVVSGGAAQAFAAKMKAAEAKEKARVFRQKQRQRGLVSADAYCLVASTLLLHLFACVCHALVRWADRYLICIMICHAQAVDSPPDSPEPPVRKTAVRRRGGVTMEEDATEIPVRARHEPVVGGKGIGDRVLDVSKLSMMQDGATAARLPAALLDEIVFTTLEIQIQGSLFPVIVYDEDVKHPQRALDRLIREQGFLMVCVCACMHACVRACVRASVQACNV